jgi:cell division protein FtsW
MNRIAGHVLIVVALLLALLGVAMIHSASSNMTELGGTWAGLGLARRQAIYLFVAVLAGVVMGAVDYRRWGGIMWWIVIAAAILLALCYEPHVGRAVKGAKRWIAVAGQTMQPSEFAKVAIVMFLGWWYDTRQDRMRTFVHGLLIPGAVTGALIALILLEVDIGTTLLLGVTVFAIWVIVGVRWWQIALAALLGAGLAGGVLVGSPERMDRLRSHMQAAESGKTEENKQGEKYQQHQSVTALGSGGLTGLGFGESRQKHHYLPEAHTDFIYAIVGEELGLAATLGVLACYVVLVVLAALIAVNAADQQGLVIALGGMCLFGVAALINIGVVTDVLPNKGMALPFLSYGGSNLIANGMLVGLIFNVWSRGSRRGSEVRLPLSLGVRG